MRAVILPAALALLAGTSACSSLECGEGTFSDGDTCVGYDPNDKTPPVTTLTPAGGRTREAIPELVAMMTDEAARIYYTTDGSDPDPNGLGETSPAAVVGVKQGTTLKYFAIDRAGNREELRETTFDSDTTAPAPVTGMSVSIAAGTATVAWTSPTDADFAGVLVARVADAITVSPTPGMIYAAPAALAPGIDVISAGKSTTFSDSGRPGGPVRYVAWAYDDVGNYSQPVSVRDQVPLGSMTAQYTFTTANMTLTRVSGPASLDLANTTATLAGNVLTMTLMTKNNSSQYFQNFKVEVTSVTGGSFTSSDGTADTFPYKSLGPELLAPGATVIRTLTFGGVAANSTVTMNFTFAHHPSMLSTAGQLQNMHVVDLGSAQATPVLAALSRGPNDRFNGRVRPAVMTGGRFLDIPTTHSTIERWDLVTRKFVFGATLSDDFERVNIQGLYATPNATFAVIKYGGRRRVAAAELVRLDEGLNVTARLPLSNDERGFSRAAFSPDYSILAIPLQAGVALVDTAKMEQIDATPSTPFSVDLIETGFTVGNRIRGVQWFSGNTGLVVLGRFNGQAAIVRRTLDDYTVTPYTDTDTNARGYGLATASDGKIWMAFTSGLRAFDPVSGNISTITYASPPNGVSVVDGKMWVIRDDRSTLDQVSNTGAIQKTITLPANTGAFGHWLELAR